VPQFFAEEDALTTAGGSICPCCASHFARPDAPSARFDLPVPPHRIATGSLSIGRTDSDGDFTIETIERL
jgi:hypothetical protein